MHCLSLNRNFGLNEKGLCNISLVVNNLNIIKVYILQNYEYMSMFKLIKAIKKKKKIIISYNEA